MAKQLTIKIVPATTDMPHAAGQTEYGEGYVIKADNGDYPQEAYRHATVESAGEAIRDMYGAAIWSLEWIDDTTATIDTE
jgi:hypothetical protein